MFALRGQDLPSRSNTALWYKTDVRECRYCKAAVETNDHLSAGCPCFSFTLYKYRHDEICRAIHHKILKKLGAKLKTGYWAHKPERLVKIGKNSIHWDKKWNMQAPLEHNKPDIVWETEDEYII